MRSYKEIIEVLEMIKTRNSVEKQALKRAIKALEHEEEHRELKGLETPKKPLPPTDMFHADRCAKCHAEVITEENYCSNCGQAIDWSELVIHSLQ